MSSAASDSRARLVFARGVSRLTILAAPAMDDLCRARFEQPAPAVEVRGNVVTVTNPHAKAADWRFGERVPLAELALNARLSWCIEIRGGASRLTADLRGLRLGAITVRGGSGRVELTLPAPAGPVPVQFLDGATNIAVHRAEGAAARVRVLGGTTNLTFDGRRLVASGSAIDLRTPGYDGASDRYDVVVTGGANNLTVDGRHGRPTSARGR